MPIHSPIHLKGRAVPSHLSPVNDKNTYRGPIPKPAGVYPYKGGSNRSHA
jgi:hypothetical protein